LLSLLVQACVGGYLSYALACAGAPDERSARDGHRKDLVPSSRRKSRHFAGVNSDELRQGRRWARMLGGHCTPSGWDSRPRKASHGLSSDDDGNRSPSVSCYVEGAGRATIKAVVKQRLEWSLG